MEKEKIWVECVNNTTGALEFLTIGKQYLATIEDEFTYTLENDKGINDWFSKQRFRIISDNDELWVECINDFSLRAKDLTVGKIYKVKETPSDKSCYLVQNDSGKGFYHSKSKFKSVDKTSILKTIETNMINTLKEVVDDYKVTVYFYKNETVWDKIQITVEQNNICGVLIDSYTIHSIFHGYKLIEKANLILKEYNIKLELEQPKFKINCDKLYTKEEAEKLKESGIDIVLIE